jgi:chromosomal replication initiation ATPase DnaA
METMGGGVMKTVAIYLNEEEISDMVCILKMSGKATCDNSLYQKLMSSLHEHFTKKQKVSPDVSFITDCTPDEFFLRCLAISGVTNDQIRCKDRHRPLVQLKASISKIMYESFENLTLKQIGEYLNKDHCTIMHYLRCVDFYKDVKDVYNELRVKLEV